MNERALDNGELVAVAVNPEVGIGFATVTDRWSVTVAEGDPFAAMAELDQRHRPRWVWWDRTTADRLVARGLALDRCWDVLTVHRLLNGGWRTSIAEVWARLVGLAPDTVPKLGQLGLLDAPADEGSDPEDPVRPDGHLRPEWTGGAWESGPQRLEAWAAVAHRAARHQVGMLEQHPELDRTGMDRILSTARSESVAELLCAELAFHGLPLDQAEAERIIATIAGPRPTTPAEEDAERARRDARVLSRLGLPGDVNLRNPAQVKAMLRREGLDLPDTRAWRLEQLRDDHPVIEALLQWRKDERIATTYGHRWLDEHVSGGRLRGEWTGSDGAAGRMTASAGLHNLPADMRSAVAADPGRVFIRADLGQIEPRVLAAVSGDRALIAATAEADLYQPIARRLGVERDVAKVAVLGAMYGATTGESAHALPGLRKNFPTAMALLEDAADRGRRREDIFTIGGRRVRMGGGASSSSGADGDLDRARSAAESRGRYARNALIQGAAAEFFKVWAVIVRRRSRALDASVVLCLHDELLVHAPERNGVEVAEVVADAIAEAAHYWSPEPAVRFLADVSIIRRWSEAK